MPLPAESRRPRVIVDGTPLLGVRTGIGRYVEHLLGELAGRPEFEVGATAFTLRGARSLAGCLPDGMRAHNRPVPARALRWCWRRWNAPPVEWMCGPTEVVHGTNFVLPPARRAAGVLSVHDLAFLTHPETLHSATADLPNLVARGLRHAAAVTTLAESTRTRISEVFAIAPEKIFVAPPGVAAAWHRAERPDAARRKELALPERYLLFIGTREPRKGLATLVRAHSLLRARLGSDAPDLLLVGAAGWGSDPADAGHPGVRVAGYVPQPVLPEIAAGAAALVLPSLDEGFGMPAVEGLAAGCPVVVSDIPVLAEATGGLAPRFPVGDADALAEVLDATLRGDAPPEQARRAWAAGFTWRRCADRTVAAYRHALATA